MATKKQAKAKPMDELAKVLKMLKLDAEQIASMEAILLGEANARQAASLAQQQMAAVSQQAREWWKRTSGRLSFEPSGWKYDRERGAVVHEEE